MILVSRNIRYLIECKTNNIEEPRVSIFHHHVKLGFRASCFRLRGFDFLRELRESNKHRRHNAISGKNVKAHTSTWEVPGFKRGPGCTRRPTNWRSTVNKDLLRMGITWEEAEVAAQNRSEWRL